MPADGADDEEDEGGHDEAQNEGLPSGERAGVVRAWQGLARLVEFVHPADLRFGRDTPGIARQEDDGDGRHQRPQAEPEPHPRKERQPDDALGDADGERVHEGRREAGVGPDKGDASGRERIVAEGPGEKEQRRQEDERLLGDADRPAADGKNDREKRHDERLPAPETPDQGPDAGLDHAGPVEDAESAANDEDIKDDGGDLEQASWESEDKRAGPGRPGRGGGGAAGGGGGPTPQISIF